MAALLLGGVLYAVSMKAVLAYKHLELIDSYNGLQQMGRGGRVADYLARLPGAYKQVFTTLLGYDVWNNRGMRLATAVCLLLASCLPGTGPALKSHCRAAGAGGYPVSAAAAGAECGVSCCRNKHPTLLMLYPVYLVYALVLLLTGLEPDTIPAQRRLAGLPAVRLYYACKM